MKKILLSFIFCFILCNFLSATHDSDAYSLLKEETLKDLNMLFTGRENEQNLFASKVQDFFEYLDLDVGIRGCPLGYYKELKERLIRLYANKFARLDFFDCSDSGVESGSSFKTTCSAICRDIDELIIILDRRFKQGVSTIWDKSFNLLMKKN